MIFMLPNGLQAFAYVGGDGQRMVDSALFSDPFASDLVERAPLSLLREHSPRVNVPYDEVLAFVRANADRYDPEQLAEIEKRYLDASELDALLDSEASTFVRAALTRAGVNAAAPEPISAAFDAYQRPLSLEARPVC